MEPIEDMLIEEVKKVSEPLGIDIVELSAKRGKNGLNIIVVIYKQDGVTIQDCERVSQLFNDRLAILQVLDEENYNLQISSPGLYRVLKNSSEYSLFKSRDVKVFLKNSLKSKYGSTELEGRLEGIKNEALVLDFKGKRVHIPLTQINKTKLNG
jgi:ribosome maturation factor RimP